MFCLAAAAHAEQPFSFEHTPGKLPKSVVPTEYAVRITPDINKLTFTGSETIKIDVRQPARELVLNSADIQIASAAVDDKSLAKSAIKLDPKLETLTIALPNELSAGAHSLALNFSGKINAAGQGLYHAPYQEHGTGAKKDMLGTQFEATDARRMFPCWDEPSFRAKFQLTAVIPENWTAVSNMPIEQETKVGRDGPLGRPDSHGQDGAPSGRTLPATKEVRFGMTPPMASYLNVLCAGELDSIEQQNGSVLHRVTATKGKAEMGRYALESAQQIVNFYNDYFGEPFPLPKLDEIAVPGGFGGAMENWGGIVYFETGLLFDPQISSSATKQGIYSVIAHEVAHQWFGDLVTMAWWDNLWLNEGFASWMGSKCTAKFNPDWEVWLRRDEPRDPTRRVGIPKETAMEGDARSTTHPIQQKIETEAEANSAFDDITYKKGQSFLRMLESFLGEDVFRDGLRRYMAAHKFSNATTADLWNALSESSGKPVADIAASWTQQPGFPVVMVARDPSGKITLTQERFTVNFQNAPALEWKIPLTYSVAGAAPVSVLMTSKTMELPDVPADRAVKFNVGGAGNYRVQYDDASWQLLAAELPKMTVADRVNLLSDAWALAQANRAPISLYLSLLSKLPTHTELAEQEQIITALGVIDGLLGDQPVHERFQRYARSILRPAFDEVGWEPKPNESSRVVGLRADLVSALASLDDPEIIAGCNERFAKFVADPRSLAPDLRVAVLGVVARFADEKTWNKLHELGLKTTSIEEKQDYLNALASVADPKLAMKTLQVALTNELPTSRALYLVPKVARYGGHPDLVWTFAKAHMKELMKKADALGANSFAPGLFTFFSDASRVAELQAFAKSSLPPEAAPQVAKAADEVSFRAEFKERLAQQLGNGEIGKELRD
ncbi:MAG: M1 family metallopeptidase [Verrucomicrobiota bacterium]|nr:M1 family metallopeptidase [Verrucomicrobiota bacterium]